MNLLKCFQRLNYHSGLKHFRLITSALTTLAFIYNYRKIQCCTLKMLNKNLSFLCYSYKITNKEIYINENIKDSIFKPFYYC